MKKITLLAAALLGWCSTQAQITYESTDFATQGETHTVSQATAGINGFDFLATGAQYTWDFATLPVTTQDQITYTDPTSTGYKTSWCFSNGYVLNCTSQFNNNFNLATKTQDGLTLQGYGVTNVYDHLKVSSTDARIKMTGATITSNNVSVPVTMTYSEPDVLYTFPMTYQNTDTGNSAYSIDLSSFGIPVQYAQQKQRTNVVEGWGQLATPFGTFSNVLKVKTTLITTQTITAQGQTQTTTTTTVSYKWFDKAYGIPVLEASGSVINGVWVATRITYIDNPRCLQPVAAFAYLPLLPDVDPATGAVTVSFINGSANYTGLTWDFNDGTTSTDQNPTHTFTCPGTKTITLTVVNNLCSPIQTATINLPVVITDTQGAYTTAVTVTGNTLTASRTLAGTTYQWVNCNANNTPIIGATEQSYTATQNGTYAVLLTTNGCTAASNCFDVMVFPPMALPELNSVTETCMATLSAPQTVNSCGETITATTSTVFPVTQTSVITWLFTDCDGTEQTTTQNITITGINPVITATDTLLTATPQQPDYYYQWINCTNNAPIEGATTAQFTPAVSGSYAVIVGLQNQCYGTSDCYTAAVAGTNNNKLTHAALYPNPTSGDFAVQCTTPVTTIAVYNILGQCVANTASVLGQENGCYIVKITLQNGTVIQQKLIKN